MINLSEIYKVKSNKQPTKSARPGGFKPKKSLSVNLNATPFKRTAKFGGD